MIKANVFKIILDNERVAFNSAIIERNDNSYALVIDKSVKRYRTYQNLFFRLVDGLYKINYTKESELKTSNNPKVQTKKINNKNLFDNFIEYQNSVKLNIETKYFELINNPDIHKEKNKEFYDLFGADVNNLLVIDYTKDNLLDKNLKLISQTYDIAHSIQEFVESIIIQDYSKAILEIESKHRFDFESLSMGALNILVNLKRYAKELLGDDVIDERVSFGLVNKCIQTTFYIPKNDLLNINSEVTAKKLSEIKQSNISITNDDELNISSVVNDIFKDEDIDSLKFTFQEELNNDSKIQKVDVYKSNFDKINLKTAIKEFKDKKTLDILSSTFLIDDIKGMYNERRTEYIFIDKQTNTKYRKVFINNKLTQDDKQVKAKLLLFVKKELNAKITFEKDTKNNDIKTIELV